VNRIGGIGSNLGQSDALSRLIITRSIVAVVVVVSEVEDDVGKSTPKTA
jgi:hypothetical protein